mmetsp:Transcript_62110/g.134842  ORF Transcript_62110/g.134842 Transcript_62110/m.134842 type:complete len:229 (-) Transcript_62110:184-870(-)
MQEKERGQREQEHFEVGAQRHLDPTYLQRPRPVPELFASERLRPAAADRSKHAEKHRRGAHKHEEHSKEDEAVVWAESSSIGQHVSLDVDLNLAPTGRSTKALHNSAWTDSQELIPWTQVTPRCRGVHPGNIARSVDELPAVLGHKVSNRPRRQLSHHVGGRQTSQGKPRAGAALDRCRTPGVRPTARVGVGAPEAGAGAAEASAATSATVTAAARSSRSERLWCTET